MLNTRRLNDPEEHSPYLIACRFGFVKLVNISESQFSGNCQLRLQFKT